MSEVGVGHSDAAVAAEDEDDDRVGADKQRCLHLETVVGVGDDGDDESEGCPHMQKDLQPQ